MFVRNSV